MERVKEIFDELNEVLESSVELNGFAVVGDKDNYRVVTVGDYDKIGENIYFALTNDSRLLGIVADAVRIASEVMPSENEEENEE